MTVPIDQQAWPEQMPPPMRRVSREPGHVLYPRLYTWVVFLASMDIIMTWVILHMGGSELNQLAATVIERWGLVGMIVLKFVSIIAVVLISEFVGRRKHSTGRFLVIAAVVISVLPVTLSFGLLVRYVHGPLSAANMEMFIESDDPDARAE